jgi:hypothetical protein
VIIAGADQRIAAPSIVEHTDKRGCTRVGPAIALLCPRPYRLLPRTRPQRCPAAGPQRLVWGLCLRPRPIASGHDLLARAAGRREAA